MTSLTPCHNSNMIPLTVENHSDEINSTLENSAPTAPITDNADIPIAAPIMDNVDIPIALRKGVGSCTMHPIENFVNYDSLSPSYKAFVTALDGVQVPNSIHEALKHPA